MNALLLLFSIATGQAASETPPQQAVLETTMGTIVLDLLAEKAPKHVAHFIETASGGGYDGTTFHRVIKYGIIQGGDPETRDEAARDKYGTGGLGVLARELNDERHTRGAVSAVQVPGQPDSAGSQFFIVITDQPTLDGQYTIFARVVEGILVAQSISEVPVDEKGLATERVEITRVTIRDRPPPEVPPFSTESLEELANYRVVLETAAGEIRVALFPDRAPNHVRNFLRLASIGAYDGVSFHRIVPGFVIQTGFLETRSEPPSEHIMKYVQNLEPEFNDTPHVPGILSMARGDDPASAQASFFIVTGIASSLDGKYTVFGEVVDGMNAVRAIEALPTDGETPLARMEIQHARIESETP